MIRKPESPLGQWALRAIAVLVAFAQGFFLFLYALVPREPRPAHPNPLIVALQLACTVLLLAAIPTFLIWLSLPDEMNSEKKRVILIATELGAPLVAFFVLVASL